MDSAEPIAVQTTDTTFSVPGIHCAGCVNNIRLYLKSATRYRLYALDGFDPPRPGLPRAEPGHSIEVEVWKVVAERFGSFVAGIPAPLGIGAIELEDGETVNGFLCEPYATEIAQDISELGGWRAYLAASERSDS